MIIVVDCLRIFLLDMWVDKLVLLLVAGVVGQRPDVSKQVGNSIGGPWWTNAVYYRLLVDSFRDEDGDGLGDLKGAVRQLSYIRALGADGIILSSISARSTNCTHPGIIDHVEIDQRYGNIGELVSLLEKAKKLDIKVIVALNLQTMSIDSDWFLASIEKSPGFENLFLWRKDKIEQDLYEWIWHEDYKGYYAATNDEAVINLCSENAVAALSAAQCTWLRRGVSGILLNPDHLLDHKCGENLLKKLAIDAKSCVRNAGLDNPVILVESSLPWEIAANYYSDGGVGAHSVVSSALTASQRRSAPEVALAIHAALLLAPSGALPTWMTSTGTQSRVASRYGSDMIDAINILALALPGAIIINQGDELGLVDTLLDQTSSDKCWPIVPQPWSSPFPWDETLNGGFTSGDPWIPISPNYRYANAKTEFKNDGSHFAVVRIAAALRKSPAIGPEVEIKRVGTAIAILRWAGTGSLLAISNIGRDQTVYSFSSIVGLPPQMTVATTSGGSSLSPGSHISTEKDLKLYPGETLLLVGPPRHCGGPGPVDRITNRLSEGWQKINKYFSNVW